MLLLLGVLETLISAFISSAYRDLFRIREKIRTQNAAARGYPGFSSSINAPGDTPTAGYLGPDAFSYKASDGSAQIGAGALIPYVPRSPCRRSTSSRAIRFSRPSNRATRLIFAKCSIVSIL